MKPRVTSRTRGAKLLWDDTGSCRYVVYRQAGGVVRKSGVRYGGRLPKGDARILAWLMARRLKAWPAHNLRQFQFNP